MGWPEALATSNGAPAHFVFQPVRGVTRDHAATFIGDPVDLRLLSLVRGAASTIGDEDDSHAGDENRSALSARRRDARRALMEDGFSDFSSDLGCSSITTSLVDSVKAKPDPLVPLATISSAPRPRGAASSAATGDTSGDTASTRSDQRGPTAAATDDSTLGDPPPESETSPAAAPRRPTTTATN